MLEQFQGVPWVLICLAHQISSTWPCHGWDLLWWLPAGSLSLLQGIFPTQESNPGLLDCRRILYQLSHKGSLVVVSGSYSLVVRGLLIAVTSCCSSLTLEHRLSGCGTRAVSPGCVGSSQTRLNWSLLHWQADALPRGHHRSPLEASFYTN